jgi:exosortase A-associated hydrolase 2
MTAAGSGSASRTWSYSLSYRDAGSSRLAIATWTPVCLVRGILLLVPPFAEEMNKSRRMMAEMSRAAAGQGWLSVLPDLTGTGDSGGDFADASWGRWHEDLRFTIQFARGLAHSGVPLAVLGLRAGSLLAAELAQVTAPQHLLLWGPVTDGRRYLNQFLRLRIAGDLAQEVERKVTTDDLRRLLELGQRCEVAGYSLTSQLSGGLDGARLESCRIPVGTTIHYFEIASEEDVSLSPAAARVLETWRQNGAQTIGRPVIGAPFWASTEIVEVPELIRLSLEALSSEFQND